MKKFYYHEKPILFHYLILICIFTPIINNSPSLNNIIQLSDDNFIYNHISINSKGDMIIDTSSLASEKRIFYGLKKNGNPYFGKSYYKSMVVVNDNYLGRSEGEVLFIKYTKRNDYSKEECMVFIPNKDNQYVEYYLFEEDAIYNFQTSSKNFQGVQSYRFSALKLKSDEETNLDYIFSYIYNQKVTIDIGNFDYYNEKAYSNIYENSIAKSKSLMISCYFTEKKIYICFFMRKKNINIWHLILLQKRKTQIKFIL